MNKTLNLGLPYIESGQAQKHVTHNEAIRALDAVVHVSVQDRDLSVPPLSPSEGDRYLVGAVASGEWLGHEGWLAAYQDGSWHMYESREGWLVWVEDESELLVRTGSGWVAVDGDSGVLPESVPRLGVNTDSDLGTRFAVKSAGVLISHDDVTPGGSGDIRIVINKRSHDRTASFIFQDDWSGRAELGLTGNDSLTIRVSEDGINFENVMEMSRNTGIVCSYPVRLPHYELSSAPSAAFMGPGALAMIHSVPAYSDGIVWRSLIDNSQLQ